MAFDGRILSGVSVLAAVVEGGSFVKAAELIGLALVQIAGAGKRPVLYCRDFKLGARHSTLQAQVDLGRPDVPVRIVLADAMHQFDTGDRNRRGRECP